MRNDEKQEESIVAIKTKEPMLPGQIEWKDERKQTSVWQQYPARGLESKIPNIAAPKLSRRIVASTRSIKERFR
jgi:hypothetical protein